MAGRRAVAEAAELVLCRSKREEFPVAARARLELLPGAGAVAREQELVLAREHQVNRRFRLLRQLAREHAFDSDAELRAEAAAHVLDDCCDGALLKAQCVRRVAGYCERALRRGVDGRLDAAAVLDDVAVRLKARVMKYRRAVLGLNDDIRLF